MSSAIPEIACQELNEKLRCESRPFLLDVRELEERDIAVLPDDLHIPLMELENRVNECIEAAKTGREFVVYCRSGARSAIAVQFLQSFGLTDAKNLRGGIRAWSHEVDPTIPTY